MTDAGSEIQSHQSRWRTPALIAVGIAFAGWLIPATAVIWDAIDEEVFFALNGTLAWGRRWQTVWAFANQKLFDGLLAVAYTAVCVWYCLEKRGRHAQRRAAEILTLLALLLVVRYIVGTVMDLLDVRRLSPSRVLEPALLLSQLLPDFAAKDGSSRSYPGDHALVALFVSLYFWARAPRPFVIVISCLLVISCLPRLVSGAHWLSDIIAGSLVFAMVAWLVAESTGLFDRAADWLERWLDRPARLVRRLLGRNEDRGAAA